MRQRPHLDFNLGLGCHRVVQSDCQAAGTNNASFELSRFETAVLQLEAFRQRSDTFSLGVCNGCQLMALLGWIAPLRGRLKGVR